MLFVPSAAEVYPPGFSATVELHGPIVDGLEGARRGAGHFRGVTTVVSKLLGMAQPDRAYFGQKDAQQARVVRALVADLNIDTEIVTVPTVREPDGLGHVQPEPAAGRGFDRARAVGVSQALADRPGARRRRRAQRRDRYCEGGRRGAGPQQSSSPNISRWWTPRRSCRSTSSVAGPAVLAVAAMTSAAPG